MISGLKTLDDINVKGKRVLVRLDLNSDIHNGRLVPSERLTAPIETLRELKTKGARVVILAHQGRPGSSDYTSLKQHARYLNKFIKIRYIQDIVGQKAINAIEAIKSGEIILLENVRSIPDELNYNKTKPNKLIKLAPLFDLYVNDAFSTSHRKHASIIGFPRHMPSAIGRVFEKELRAVQKLHVSGALFVLGGSKPEDNIALVNGKNKILASGLFGPFCLMARGANLGLQNKIMKKSLAKRGKIKTSNMILPSDLAIEINGKRKDIKIDEFPVNKEILDLGINTIENYVREIQKAKVIFFKGLAGLCNKPDFSIGTRALLLALSESRAFTIVSGGHTLTMIEKLKIPRKKFGYVSLSGGALIHYLAESTLPGIEALRH